MRRSDMRLIFEQDHGDISDKFTIDNVIQWSSHCLACFLQATKTLLRFDSASNLLSRLDLFSEQISGILSMSPCGRVLVARGKLGARLHCSLDTSATKEMSGGSTVSHIAWHPCPPSGQAIYAVALQSAHVVLVDACQGQNIACWDLSDTNISSRTGLRSCTLSWSPEGRKLIVAHAKSAIIICFDGLAGNASALAT